MIKVATKEQLVYFMQSGALRLSKIDVNFLQNLNVLCIKHKPITSNQLKLFDKICNKYQKQLNKFKLTKEKINSFTWADVKIVTSDPQFTEAYIEVIENKILIRCPFSRKFVSEFRKLDTKFFVWNKIEKQYESTFGTYQLKQAVDSLTQFFEIVNYCKTTEKLLNTLSDYKNIKYWHPTLIKRNNNFFIAGANEFVVNATKHIELNLDYKTLFELSKFGIEVDSSLKLDDRGKFANSRFLEIDISDFEKTIDWLIDLNVDCVAMFGLPISNIQNQPIIDKDYIQRLISKNISIINYQRTIPDSNPKVPVLFYFTPMISKTKPMYNKLVKVIKVNNASSVNFSFKDLAVF